MAPQVIFWDVGNTLIRSHTRLTITRLSTLSGKTSDEVRRLVWGKDGKLFSVFDCALLGTIGTKRVIRSVRKRLELEPRFIPNRRILRTFLGTLELPKEICYLLYFLSGQGTVQELREGKLERVPAKNSPKLPMGIISNLTKLSWRHIEDTFPVFRIDTGVFNWRFISCKEGVRKPDKEIYARAFEAARKHLGNNLNPYDCLFFDDQADNILTAQAFGFRAIKTARAGDAKIFETLHALGVPLPPADFSPPRYVIPSREDIEKGVRKFKRVV